MVGIQPSPSMVSFASDLTERIVTSGSWSSFSFSQGVQVCLIGEDWAERTVGSNPKIIIRMVVVVLILTVSTRKVINLHGLFIITVNFAATSSKRHRIHLIVRQNESAEKGMTSKRSKGSLECH